MKIGFIGLGIMGKPMAKNLVKAGYSLMVNNLTPEPVAELVACGAEAATQKEIGQACDIVMTMVPNSPQVKEIMLGEGGVGAQMKPGSIFIDNSFAERQAVQQQCGVPVFDVDAVDMLLRE